MKSKIILLFFISISLISVSQVSELDNNSVNAAQYLGWDAASTIPLNIRHNRSDQPIDFYTNSILRMHINAGNAIEPITSAPTGGFVGIGPCRKLFSRLTISNRTDTVIGGFRTWMQTGVFSHQSTDNMYVGLRENIPNRFDAIISWSDDATPLTRMDKLRFTFTGSPIGGTGTNPRSMNSVNGYEFMVMTPMPGVLNSVSSPIGHIGIGPLFSDANLPQSRLHINAEDNLQAFTQISNEQTGIGPNDGMRLGIVGTAVGLANGTALLYNQEDRPLLLSNNANTNTVNLVTGATNERVRVTSVGTPTNLTTGLVGTYTPPGNLAGSTITRVAISHNPATPATRPLSLLHLGYNMNGTGTNSNGWRNWMDIGTFTTNGTDHVYLGLKHEGATNRQDAVLSWGDDQAANGPDNLRFIFTSQTAGGGTTPATGTNGLEGMRLTPTTTTGVRVGIGGSPTDNAYTGGTSAGNTLEVNAWGNNTTTPGGSSGLRFTNLNTTSPTLENPGEGILTVDANGDVIYVEDGGGDDCRWVDYTDPVTSLHFGLYTGVPTGAFATPCNDMNVGIGSVPTFKDKLYVETTSPNQNSAIHGRSGHGNGGEFWGGAQGVECHGIGSGIAIRGFGGGFMNGGTWATSDENLKHDIQPLENGLEIIAQLNPKRYFFRTEEYPGLGLTEGLQYGVLAQELEAVMPHAVRNLSSPVNYVDNTASPDSMTIKMIEADQLIPVLVQAIKEQQTQINAMQDQINGCCTAHGEVTPEAPGMPTGNPQYQQSIALTNADKAMLGFASPNPNKGEVYVDYYIPTNNSGTAEMLFTDATGRPVQNVLITSKGNGRLNIDTATLAAGQYQYTLIVDGEIIATRKMIRE